MTATRLLPALPALALLAACGGDAPAERGAASGEVLEGTISDDMLPIDRVRSEPPLQDPEAFAGARDSTDDPGRAVESAEAEGGVEGQGPADESAEQSAPAPAPVTPDE